MPVMKEYAFIILFACDYVNSRYRAKGRETAESGPAFSVGVGGSLQRREGLLVRKTANCQPCAEGLFCASPSALGRHGMLGVWSAGEPRANSKHPPVQFFPPSSQRFSSQREPLRGPSSGTLLSFCSLGRPSSNWPLRQLQGHPVGSRPLLPLGLRVSSPEQEGWPSVPGDM